MLANWAALEYGLTLHNRANYAVCKICNDSKDNGGNVRVKNFPDYEGADGSKRSTSKLANHLINNFCPSYSCSGGVWRTESPINYWDRTSNLSRELWHIQKLLICERFKYHLISWNCLSIGDWWFETSSPCNKRLVIWSQSFMQQKYSLAE